MISRVLMICNTVWPFYRGGYEKRYFEIAKRLSNYGIEVTLLTSVPTDIKMGNVKFKRVTFFDTFFEKNSTRSLKKEVIFNINLLFKIVTEFRYQYDIIDVNQTPPLHIIPSKLYEYFKGIPLVCTVHEELAKYIRYYARIKYGAFMGSFIAPIMLGFYLRTMKMCNNFIAVSKIVAEEIKRIYNGKVHYVPNGIDFGIISKYRSRKIGKDASTVISFIGRLVIEKRPHWILKLARDLIYEGYNDFTIYIVGQGPMYDELVYLASKYNIGNKVKFLGNVDEDVKYNILSITDIFVLPSLREGFSIATLEAMAFGIPPVVTAIPGEAGISGHLEYIKHEFNALVSKDYDEFKRNVMKLINDINLRKRLGKAAENTAKMYDWNTIVLKLIKVYNGIISGNKP